MHPDKQEDIDRRLLKIETNTADEIKRQWPFKPYYDEAKDVIILPQPQLKKDGTLKGGVLHQIVGKERGQEVHGFRKAAIVGLLRGTRAENRREAYAMIVAKQAERALADDGNVQAAVFVAKAIGAFQRIDEKPDEVKGVQINISPEIAREILDRMRRGDNFSSGTVVDAE